MKRFYNRLILCLITICLACGSVKLTTSANAMPFYDLQPQEIVLRSKFFTSYPTSSDERKSNIALAASAINNTLVDVGCEFSFNQVVGVRSASRGYKTAKIIVNGKFVDGVGGGVCQVSTTLYNAVLLAGLKITEYHPHSLPVSYVAPSFDAMVSSGSADFRFINNTHNPIVIYAAADSSLIKIEIHGEPMQTKLVRKSVITEELLPPKEELVIDERGEYPDLFFGERRVIAYSKAGYKSEGYLIELKDGNPVSSKRIRTDSYGGVAGVIVEGRAERTENSVIESPLSA